MNDAPQTKKGHCPECRGQRNCSVEGYHRVKTEDEHTTAIDEYMILKCLGCGTVFFRKDIWFSEWDTRVADPQTGEVYGEEGTLT
jgi:hypothetical protein